VPAPDFTLAPDAVPFAAGRDADVYALSDGLVLRRSRDGHDVSEEAATMRHAGRHGYPVPAVHQVAGPDMVLQRLDGPTAFEAALDGQLSGVELGTLLADLHRRLHDLPSPSGDAGLSLIHCDFHPQNVILTADGPMVIDWRNAGEGVAEFDIAMTAVILGQVALDPAFGEQKDAVLETLLAYLRGSVDPSAQLDAALARRDVDRGITAEERAVLPAAGALIRDTIRTAH
jgi:aminoglycoside phosphotransferase (APT) family kinase protein